MDEALRREIATWRYQMIAGVVNRATPLKPGEVSAYFREMTERSWRIPGCPREHVSIRSLERYKHLYEHGGFEALLPAVPPKRGPQIPLAALDSAKALRIKRPERSVEQIIFTLEETGVVKKGILCPSTLSRWFRKENLTKQKIQAKDKPYGFRRFEADAPHRLWQCDFQHTLYLSDPLHKGRKRKVKLCLILDDFSRYVVHAQFFWDEKMPVLEETLKKAIEKHGLPQQFFCDNGSAFTSKHLANICARLGIQLSHSTPYRPQGRGKVEKIFQFVDSSFLPEAYLAIERSVIGTLEELNKSFALWLDGYYHLRKHGSTKQTPQERLRWFPTKPLPYGKEELRRFFFLEETRQADKTACISLNGLIYEVDQELAGCKVQVRYDPFDPRDAEVYYAGVHRGTARLLDARQNFRQNKVSKRSPEVELSKAASPKEPSLFDAAKLGRAKRLDDLSYRQED